ncbi:MAG: hypothetical protein ACOY3L_09695 [Pseudomonadota bacterium]
MLRSGVGGNSRLLTSKPSRVAIALAALVTVLALAHPSWADDDDDGWGHWRKHRGKVYYYGGYPAYVYAPPPAYVVVPPPPPPVVYAAPAPVYVAPAPVYAEPSINLVFPIKIH